MRICPYTFTLIPKTFTLKSSFFFSILDRKYPLKIAQVLVQSNILKNATNCPLIVDKKCFQASKSCLKGPSRIVPLKYP